MLVLLKYKINERLYPIDPEKRKIGKMIIQKVREFGDEIGQKCFELKKPVVSLSSIVTAIYQYVVVKFSILINILSRLYIEIVEKISLNSLIDLLAKIISGKTSCYFINCQFLGYSPIKSLGNGNSEHSWVCLIKETSLEPFDKLRKCGYQLCMITRAI